MSQYFQSVDLTPAEVTAGDSARFEFRLVLGPDFPDQPSRIILDLPATGRAWISTR